MELAFEAAEPGLRDLRVVLTRYEDEVTWRNNESRFDVQVLDQKKSILLLAGAPSPDVSAVRRLLEADDTASLTVRTQKPDGTWHEGDLPEDLDDVDLIVAVGFPGNATDPAASVRITDAVSAGTPLLFMMDRSTSMARLQQSFASLLPLQPRVVRPTYIEGTFQQAPAAASHAVFDIDDRREGSLWRRLPPLSLSESQWEAAAGATVLATSEIRGVSLPDPVLAVMRRGQVKTAALTAHGF
ncbi:MAG: NAD(P)-dependent oxidoreductase, partial [Bacteroidetes bacterium]|nr:NAD(P)-dependent oxidoreductase [Bacteroidota bacterium]